MANAVTGNRYEEAGGNGSGGGGGGARPPRLPRWTRQEILVLIQGKKVAESRGRGGRAGSRAHHMGASAGALVGAGSPVEPKWATVSSYCRRHGVNRGPVQCRKRWSNLASDYKKIKEWERRRRPDGGEESFWVMRNDLRRERRLPGFFDREVYDILDGSAEPEPEPEEEDDNEATPPPAPRAAPAAPREEDEEEAAAVFDSGRTAAEDGLFSDSEPEQDEGAEEEDKEEERPVAPPPPTLATPISGMASSEKQQPEENPEKGSSSREGQKRKRPSSGDDAEEDNHMQNQLIHVLERNSRTLMAHLEAQNMNCQLDREQRKEHADSLVGVLGKVADALAKIADKL